MGFEQQGEVMEQIKPIEFSVDEFKLLLGTDSKTVEKRIALMHEKGIGEHEVVAITVDGERKLAVTTQDGDGFDGLLSSEDLSNREMVEWLEGQ